MIGRETIVLEILVVAPQTVLFGNVQKTGRFFLKKRKHIYAS